MLPGFLTEAMTSWLDFFLVVDEVEVGRDDGDEGGEGDVGSDGGEDSERGGEGDVGADGGEDSERGGEGE